MAHILLPPGQHRSIKSVINYDTAKDIDTHVHRIGRTGRAGDKEGVAYTLVNANQVKAAGMSVGQSVCRTLTSCFTDS